MLLATHDMAEAEIVCDRVTLIDRGKIIATESPRTLGQLISRFQRIDAEDVPEPLLDESAPFRVSRAWVPRTGSVRASRWERRGPRTSCSSGSSRPEELRADEPAEPRGGLRPAIGERGMELWMEAFLAGFRLELRIIRSHPDALMLLFTAPLFATHLHGDRSSERARRPRVGRTLCPGADDPARVAPSTQETMAGDRWQATLELMVAAPTNVATFLFGSDPVPDVLRAALARGGLGGREPPVRRHPPASEEPFQLAVALAVTTLAMGGLAVRSQRPRDDAERVHVHELGELPLYLLGAVFVPVTFLPDWAQPISTVLFVRGAGLLRATPREAPADDYWPRLGRIVLLGAITFAIGRVVLHLVLRRMRANGELSVA